MRRASAGSIPIPESSTTSATLRPARSSEITTLPPAGVYLTALSTRFSSARRRAPASPCTTAGAVAPMLTLTPLPLARRTPSSSASRQNGSRSTAWRGALRPTVERDKSSRSSARRISWSTSSMLETRTRRYSSGERSARSAISMPPRSAVSGVLSSCAASAVKRCISANAACRRASIALSVSASRSISSWVPRRSRRRLRSSALILSALCDMRSTGRSARRARSQPPAAESTTPSGTSTSRVST